MAEQTGNQAFENLKQEFANLKEQLENLLKNTKEKKTEEGSELLQRLSRELEHLRQTANKQAHSLYETGLQGAEDVTERVRRNPLASVLIAFGAGYALSCIFRHLR